MQQELHHVLTSLHRVCVAADSVRRDPGTQKGDGVARIEVRPGHVGADSRASRSGTTPIFAIDPGTTSSGWVLYDGGRVTDSGVDLNSDLVSVIGMGGFADEPAAVLAIEMIASYGMAVGREVFETCVWIGRFKQAWRRPEDVRLIYRKDVKMHLCGTPRAKDPNVRQALIDKLGSVGTKKAPGPLYGVTSHAWPALGVAVTALELIA